MMDSAEYIRARELIDEANRQDPNREMDGDTSYPKELLYSRRMTEMIERFRPEADEVMKLAVRGQHIERWTSPRADFPAGRVGYLQWRTQLYAFHGSRVAGILAEVGFDEAACGRVEKAVGKRQLKLNPDSQLLEDVASLVFVEHYLEAFVDQHPEYDEAKWIGILSKTWKKISEDARVFALAGNVKLPEAISELLPKAIATSSDHAG